MTALTLTLTPAQWEHLDRHGWTLTEAPTTECRNTLHDLRNAPVSEYHCPECGRAPYRAKDGDWYCFDPKGESSCRWRGPNPKVTPCCVPATVPCPARHCRGGVNYGTVGPCPTCSGSGVVPRTVGIVRPPSVLSYDGEVAHPIDPATVGDWYEDAVLPAELVGTATVTPVPVAAYPAPLAGEHIEADDTATWWWPDTGPYIDVTALFATPPATTVWRLDKENNR